MELQKPIDKEKEKMIVKLAMGLSVSKPAILLHSGDDWCWLQYHAIKFLERDAYVFIKKENQYKQRLKISSTEHVTVVYYEDKDDLLKLTKEACDEYVHKIMKEESME